MSNDNIRLTLTPDQSLQKLIDGNQRFVQGFDAPDSFKYQDQRMSHAQHPYACILGCADSRISPEHAFDESHGNLFVTRVAGNFVTPEILASLEYGTSVLGASVIVVLGHTGCGAIRATINAQSTSAVFTGHINQLINALVPSVRNSLNDNVEIWKENAVHENVKLNVMKLRQSEPILRHLQEAGTLKIVGAIYSLETGLVDILTF